MENSQKNHKYQTLVNGMHAEDLREIVLICATYHDAFKNDRWIDREVNGKRTKLSILEFSDICSL